MPRLTRSRCHMRDDKRLPDKHLMLSKKGCTSLVYHHPADPANRVLVYTVEAAKAHYWESVGFSFERDYVGRAEFAGYPRTTFWYGTPKYMVESYDLHECEVPRVSFDFSSCPALRKERDRARKIVDGLFTKHLNDKHREHYIWEELDTCDIEALRIGADFALNYDSDLYPQNPRDAFCIWNDKLFWLDPYHDRRLLEMIRASVHLRHRGW